MTRASDFAFCAKLHVVMSLIDIPFVAAYMASPSHVLFLKRLFWCLIPLGLEVIRAVCAVHVMLDPPEAPDSETWMLPIAVSFASFVFFGFYAGLFTLCFITSGSIYMVWVGTANGCLGIFSACIARLPLNSPGGSEQFQPEPEAHDPMKDELVSQLTLQTFTAEAGSTECTECELCVICLAPHCPGDVLRKLHCLHTFHASCFEPWIWKGGRSCPMRCAPPLPLVEDSKAGMLLNAPMVSPEDQNVEDIDVSV